MSFYRPDAVLDSSRRMGDSGCRGPYGDFIEDWLAHDRITQQIDAVGAAW